MDLTFRRAEESDLPTVLRLYAQPGFGDGHALDLDRATAIFRRMAGYPDYGVYVAVVGGAVVGTLALLIMDNLAHHGAPAAVVESVCVDQSLRGQGIGRALMGFALEQATARGCYKLTLSSNLHREDAHAFYRSLGYEQHGISFRTEIGRGGPGFGG